ncbi:PREDICTED: uncharacterized protein LOC104816187 [Tarenaya hassleriana]|uniref:uncharacterized protein LOC104816187 n=1 Tax=Tarenaya hassleriana TaxID=28532 RepID=UPI00053C340C|nr:PREDICTED: uncharacterized protein LOC104816187 [Tarenaya hassleriana]XP_010543189.1 PREDICTED: uncharacterized protein LOC104816187 [Tarenaya hassleriana]
MWDPSQKCDLEELLSYGDDLIKVLRDKKGFDVLAQSFEHLKAIQFSCDEDFSEIQRSIEDCQKKLDACKKKTEDTNSGIVSDYELERIQKELDEELERERLLKEELRTIADEINDLNGQRALVEEQRLALKRKEQVGMRAEKMLSMYASVTKVIPNLDDPSKISGNMVDRDKTVIEKFEFDQTKMTAYEACNCVWNIVYKQ